MSSSRFVVAIHLLAVVDFGGGEPVTSEHAAASINTNPAFVRRIAMSLRDAGLVTAQLGSGGGLLLARPVSAITLLEVYRAVETQELFAMHRAQPNVACDVGGNIQGVLLGRLDRVRNAMERELEGMTLADIVLEIRSASGGVKPPEAQTPGLASGG